MSRPKNNTKLKRKNIIFIFLGVLCLIVAIHGVLYITYGLPNAEKMIREYRRLLFDSTYDEQCKCIELIKYDDLSLIYKSNIKRESYINAQTDEEIYDIYNKIISLNFNSNSESFFSTFGYDMSSGYDVLYLGDRKYRFSHDVDVKVDYFTFNAYISKWIITVQEV